MTAAERLAELPPRARAAALAALDEITRPMTKIEIEDAFGSGMSRRDRRAASRLLIPFDVIAVVRRQT